MPRRKKTKLKTNENLPRWVMPVSMVLGFIAVLAFIWWYLFGPYEVYPPADAAFAEPLWKFHAPEQIGAPFAFTDQQVFVRTDSKLYALNVSDGSVMWEKSVVIGANPIAPLLVVEDVLLAPDDRDKGSLWAFSLPSGNVLWQTGVTNNQGQREDTYVKSMAKSKEIVGVAWHDEALDAYNVHTGQLLWEGALTGRSAYVYAVADIFYLKVDGDIYAYHRSQKGELLWKIPEPCREGASKTSLIDERFFYIHCTEGKLLAFDLQTKKVVWATPVKWSYATSALVLDKDVLYVKDIGKLKAISTQTGDILWEKTWLLAAVSKPMVLNGKIYIKVSPKSESFLYAIERTMGEVLWQYPINYNDHASPVAIKDLLIVPVSEQDIYAFRP
jgi:outer membrane protein assembly factor BamB